MTSENQCGICGLPIIPSEPGLRHFGTFTAHSEARCVELLRAEIERLRTENRELSKPAYEFESYPKEAGGRRAWVSAGAWLYPGDALGVQRIIEHNEP